MNFPAHHPGPFNLSGPLWFHGSPTSQPLPDMGAMWLSDQWVDATCYAGLYGTLHVCTVQALPPSLDPLPAWKAACQASGLNARKLRPSYIRGRLWPEDQRPLLAYAQAQGWSGLHLQDRTAGLHKSLALFTGDLITWHASLPMREVRRWQLKQLRQSFNPPSPIPLHQQESCHARSQLRLPV